MELEFILGASDVESEAISRILENSNVAYSLASFKGKRVGAGNAYNADGKIVVKEAFSPSEIILVECAVEGTKPTRIIDHHRPGDYGFLKGPAEFLSASSIGQVISLLSKESLLGPGAWDQWASVEYQPAFLLIRTTEEAKEWWYGDDVAERKVYLHGIPFVRDPQVGEFYFSGRWWWIYDSTEKFLRVNEDIVMTAASDHCLAAAYAGKCPGVKPEDLRDWRIMKRSQFQGIPEHELWKRIEEAESALLSAPEIGPGIKDLRNRFVPELPETATFLGLPYLSRVKDGSGRWKVVVGGAGADTRAGTAPIEWFLNEFVPSAGLVDPYGSPVRGYAGAYEKEE